jgi:hypothetical protein
MAGAQHWSIRVDSIPHCARLRARRSRRNAEAFILVAILGFPIGAYAASDHASASIVSLGSFSNMTRISVTSKLR